MIHSGKYPKKRLNFTLALGLLASGLAVTGLPLASNAAEAIKIATSSPIKEKKTSFFQTTGELNLRKGPGAKHSVILTIPKGGNVAYISKTGNWVQVEYSGKMGFVHSKYLKSIISPVVLDVPFVSQLTPTYTPLGCEGASLLMALKYKGYTDISLKAFLDNMPKSKKNPYTGYSSTPYKAVKEVYQSIFPKPLAAYGRSYNAQVKDATGYSTKQLKAEIDSGHPIVVYVSNKFAAPKWGTYNMGSAGNVKAMENMHVVTLIGYDKETGDYLVNDPNSKKESQFWVKKAAFEKSYNSLKYAVVVR
ncbi:hypothetical protein D1B33_15750 [Lysinibacillus yapensis]|uniref:SH3b domain-containing protein n=1 Tax=Ureibacillus yapensis TaxID=2304605 RepID=A0A396SBY1_9BACL|nr:C39 family peptidase [Lysinibacillus yapensis]RHW33495.1 hypothetical protein D1B33_15750 [Lysinibacillus yapensis]